MNKFTVKESEWGPAYLRDRNTDKRCCLGFAAEQCGIDPAITLGAMMPSDVMQYFTGNNIEFVPTKFAMFLRGLEMPIDKYLAKELDPLIKELQTLGARHCGHLDSTTIVSVVMACINDSYHDIKDKNQLTPELDHKVKFILRSLANQGGFDLDFVP